MCFCWACPILRLVTVSAFIIRTFNEDHFRLAGRSFPCKMNVEGMFNFTFCGEGLLPSNWNVRLTSFISSIHPSVHLFLHLSIHSFTHPFVYLSINPFIHPSSIPTFIHHQFLHPPIHPSIHLISKHAICCPKDFFAEKQIDAISRGWKFFCLHFQLFWVSFPGIN